MIHNEVERLQTSLYDKAGVAPYYVAEDKESVFIGTLFYFAQNNHTVLCNFHKFKKYAKKVLQLRLQRSNMMIWK